MAALSWLQTLWPAQLPVLSQTAWLGLDDSGTGPALLVQDVSSAQQARFVIGAPVLQPGSAHYSALEQAMPLPFAAGARSLDRAMLDRVRQGDGSGMAYLDGVGFAGNLVALHQTEAGGRSLLFAALPQGAGLSCFELSGADRAQLVQTVPGGAARYLDGITALTSLTRDGRHWLIALSGRENGLTTFEIGSDGSLRMAAGFGFSERLPIDRPTALELVEIGGRSFVLVAAFGSNSLTVLELRGDGTLVFQDQVIDSLATRFAGPLALDAITLDGQSWVAIAGGDGGVSLFQLLPGGRLLHHHSLIDDVASALDGVRQLQFVPGAAGLELFALSSRDTGLSRLGVAIGPGGVQGVQGSGTAANDILNAAPGGMELRGLGGDDILIDGSGEDWLQGGAGADQFLFQPDGRADTIADFDPAEDRIDLSAFFLLHGPGDLDILPAGTGARLQWGQETLHVHSAAGGRLEAADFSGALLFNSDHVVMPDPLPILGGDGDDVFEWSPGSDTIDGAGGFDTLVYAAAPEAAVVDLADNARNAGAAAGNVLRNIEAVVGTDAADALYGDAAANALSGGAGDDTLRGGDGTDWLTPGPGSDRVFGGGGRDMVSYVDLGQGVQVNLAGGWARSGADTDLLNGIEQVTGTVRGDFIQGDDGDNRLRGLGDYDWLIGSGGADQFDGGTGRDMVSYVYAEGPVTVNLALGQGLAGQAAGDSYTSIERVTGSIHADLIYGDGQENDLRGLGGYDWFVGSGGGKDRYDGGSGQDTVAYSQAAAGVRASLLLGRGSSGDAARDLYTSIESLTGSVHADELTGDHGRNVLRGLYGADRLFGNGGVDRLEGGGSDDFLDGGAGWDYAIFAGNRADYTVQRDGAVTLVDRIAPGGEGTDTLVNIEVLQFADGLLYL